MARYGFDFRPLADGYMGLVNARENRAAMEDQRALEAALFREEQEGLSRREQRVQEGLTRRAQMGYDAQRAAQAAGYAENQRIDDRDRGFDRQERLRGGLIADFNMRGSQFGGDSEESLRETQGYMNRAADYASTLPDDNPSKQRILQATTPGEVYQVFTDPTGRSFRTGLRSTAQEVRGQDAYRQGRSGGNTTPGIRGFEQGMQAGNPASAVQALFDNNPALQNVARSRPGVQDNSSIKAVQNGEDVSIMVDAKQKYNLPPEVMARARQQGYRPEAMEEQLTFNKRVNEGLQAVNNRMEGRDTTSTVPLTVGAKPVSDPDATPLAFSPAQVNQVVQESKNANNPDQYQANMFRFVEDVNVLTEQGVSPQDVETLYARAFQESGGDMDKLGTLLAKSTDAYRSYEKGGTDIDNRNGMKAAIDTIATESERYSAPDRARQNEANIAKGAMSAEGELRRQPLAEKIADSEQIRAVEDEQSTNAGRKRALAKTRVNRALEDNINAIQEIWGDGPGFISQFTDGDFSSFDDVYNISNTQDRNTRLYSQAQESISQNLAPWEGYFGKNQKEFTTADYAEAIALYGLIQKDAPYKWLDSAKREVVGQTPTITAAQISKVAENNKDRLRAFRAPPNTSQ
jgi:hypothetical protein